MYRTLLLSRCNTVSEGAAPAPVIVRFERVITIGLVTEYGDPAVDNGQYVEVTSPETVW
jgi:hypothetical protein